jgi:CelD/BcsL family acetyltransferase involved in cellulose biosynthesis
MFPDRLTVLIAERAGKVIGPLITFRHPHMASLEHIGYDDNELLARPNHLLYATAIEKACQEGYPQVDFGKTSPNSLGLLDFKRRWGAEETEIAYFVHPATQDNLSLDEDSAARRLFRTVNRALSLPLAHMLGKVIYRQIG